MEVVYPEIPPAGEPVPQHVQQFAHRARVRVAQRRARGEPPGYDAEWLKLYEESAPSRRGAAERPQALKRKRVKEKITERETEEDGEESHPAAAAGADAAAPAPAAPTAPASTQTPAPPPTPEGGESLAAVMAAYHHQLAARDALLAQLSAELRSRDETLFSLRGQLSAQDRTTVAIAGDTARSAAETTKNTASAYELLLERCFKRIAELETQVSEFADRWASAHYAKTVAEAAALGEKNESLPGFPHEKVFDFLTAAFGANKGGGGN